MPQLAKATSSLTSFSLSNFYQDCDHIPEMRLAFAGYQILPEDHPMRLIRHRQMEMNLRIFRRDRMHEIFGLYGYKILNLCFIISLDEFVSKNGYSEKTA